MAPSFEEGSGLSVLKHAGGAHNNHRIVLFGVDAGVLLEVVDVPVLERIGLHILYFTYSL